MSKNARQNAGLGNPPSPYYTNASESANAVIKRAVGFKENKTPAQAFTPPAEKKKGHKVVFRQKSKRVTGLYNI